jgi:signal transduction histidine kinase
MKRTEAPENCRIDTVSEQNPQGQDASRRWRVGLAIGAAGSALLGAALARSVSGEWGPASLVAAAFGSGCLLAGAALGKRPAAPGLTGPPLRDLGNPPGPSAEYDSVLRSVTHDLRSPLGAIVNFASVLEHDHDGELGEEASQLLMRIRRAAHSALELLDGLARLTQLAREPLHPVRVDAEELARDAFASLPHALRRVELSLGSLPDAIADPALLQACFAELLANAAKFSGGREKAQVAVGGRREPDGSVVYWVADDGVGFDPRFAGRLFRVFERLHARDEFPGAGVGLAIVRHAAERHGGRAWAESEPGRGARFYLSFPAGAEAAP